ncbi:hypothetical protein Q7P37_004181 [Cladosporium fusiforme]
MSYGSSKKWIAPGVKEKQKHEKLNLARSKICANSPFWYRNFDLAAHKREFALLVQGRMKSLEHTLLLDSPETPIRGNSGGKATSVETPSTCPSAGDSEDSFSTLSSHPSTPSRSAFSGKTLSGPVFTSNLSPVLALPTVFTPQYKLGRPFIAPWPSKSEMKYEGDDRIATDKLHGRFLGAPRVESNETVNWQHRNVIEQYDLENYHTIPSEAAVMLKSHYVDEADHATEEEAKHMLGAELYALLDPVDCL